MHERSRMRRWLAPTVWSLGLLAVVLAGSIASVTMLSDRDAITLAGGIAIFAVAITAWFAVTTATWVRALRAQHRVLDPSPPGPPREVQRPPLVHR